jgi:uncharacterized membrane protein
LRQINGKESAILTTFTVIKFPTVGGAQTMPGKLQQFQEQRLIQVEDGAILTWPRGARHPSIKQLSDLAGVNALDEGFWGMLFGLLFSVPFFGAPSDAVFGPLADHFARYGIDEGFIQKVRDQITEDTSALFLLANEALLEQVAANINNTSFDLISTTLTYEQEARLRDAFGQESLAY